MTNGRIKTITNSISACPIWPTQTAQKVGQMIDEIKQANAIMSNISATAQHDAVKAGFAAETFHGEGFNLDAILKDKDVRAFTDVFANTPIARNDPTHDIVVVRDGKQVLGAQLKYYKDADATQKAFRSSKYSVHHYEKSDLFLAPSDQVDGIRASANKTAWKNQQSRPEVSRAAEKVRDNSAGQFEVDGVQSPLLSKRDAEHLGAGTKTGKDLHERMQNGYLNKASVQQSMRAAGSAAVITAVTAGCINTFQYIKQLRSGEITAEEAAMRVLRDTAIAAGDSALKAGVATASVSMTARALPQLFAGPAFQSSFATGTVAGAAICAVDLVQCIVLFAVGKMTREELETRTGKNVLQTGRAVVGASVGGAIGALGGPAAALVGSLVGGMITSLAMNVALDNHVEKNFRLTLDATQQVVGNGVAARHALKYLHLSQAFYADFEKGLMLSERHFTHQTRVMQAQSSRLKSTINNL